VPPIEATANLAEHDAVRAVTQSRLQQIPDFNSGKGILGATGREANRAAPTSSFFVTTRAFLSPRRSADFA
jgi:hypothetical protein